MDFILIWKQSALKMRHTEKERMNERKKSQRQQQQQKNKIAPKKAENVKGGL